MSVSALAVQELALVLARAADVLLARHAGLTFARFQVLRALHGDGSLSQHTLARKIGIDDAALSRMLPGLQANDLVQVVQDPAHGRRKLVMLTTAGQVLVQDAEQTLGAAFVGAAHDAGVDVERLSHDLQRLSEQVKTSMVGGPNRHKRKLE